MDLALEDLVGDAVVGAARRNAQTLEQVGEADVVGAMVDDEAHSTVVGVSAKVDNRARKAAVGHQGHGDEELSFEVALVALFALRSRQVHERETSAVPARL